MKPSPTRKPLALALLAALSAASVPALAKDECGTATTGKVECTADVPQVRYDGVEDFELVLRDGVVIDGRAMPEGETAVVVYGKGDLAVTGGEGSAIVAHDAWPALEVVSLDGNVSVDVDTVVGGNVGIHAASGAGDVDVKANIAAGDIAIDAHALGIGNVTVDVQEAYAGFNGAGVYATAQDGDVHIGSNRTWAEADFATGLWGTAHQGDVTIDANFVRAEGRYVTGILGESFAEGDVNIGVNTVTVGGDGSVAILALSVDGDINIDAGYVGKTGDGGGAIGVYAINGGANIRVEQVFSAGAYARALDVQTTGDANLDIGYASTDGIGSHAVNVEAAGGANIKVGGISTFGADSFGVFAVANDTLNLDIANVNTFGALSAAVLAEAGFDGDLNARLKDIWMRDGTNEWFAVGLNTNEGDVTALAEGTIHAENGYAITTSAHAGKSHIQVAQGASVWGGTTALDSATGGGARFDILGTIDSGTGPVIRAGHSNGGNGNADVRIGKTGKVHGYMHLTDAADIVTNAGTWHASGTSLFGAGEDRIVNVGTFALDGTNAWMCFDGLETFENAGRVSLQNGRTGDIFGTLGTIHGAGGAFAVDLDLASGKADEVHAAKFTGVSVIDLGIVGRGSALGLSDVVIAKSASEQSGDEIVLSRNTAYRGFVGFSLRNAGGEWMLSSDLADEAYLAAAVPAGVRDLWRQGAQSVATHLAATQGGEDSDGLWMQAVGGDFDGTSSLSHARGATELEWHGSHEGVQAGFELAFGHWRTGVTGGFSEASMDLGGSEETTLDSVNAGLYARWDYNGWFAGGLLRAERVDVETRWNTIGLNAQGDGSVVGFEFDGGYHLDLGGAYLEPSIRVSTVDVSLPDQVGRGGTVRWEDAAMGTAEIGVRLGATEGWHGWRPYAAASFAREIGDADETVYALGSDTARVTDAGDRSFGRIAGGVEVSVGRFDLYGEVEARVGDMEGTTGRLGARLRF